MSDWHTIANFVENKKFLDELGIKCTLDGLHAVVKIETTKIMIADPKEFNGFCLGLRVGRNMRGNHV